MCALLLSARVLEVDVLPEVVVCVLVNIDVFVVAHVECEVGVVPHAVQQRVAAEAEVAGQRVDVATTVACTEAVAGLGSALIACRVPA